MKKISQESKCTGEEKMDKRHIDSLYRIIQVMNNKRIKENKKLAKLNHSRKITVLFFISIIILLISIVIQLTNIYTIKSHFISNISLLFLMISYIFIVAQPLFFVLIHKKTIKKIISNPFDVLLHNSKKCAVNDLRIIKSLRTKSKKELELLKLELIAEKNESEKRVSLLIGAIEKIGIFPGILALIVTVSKIEISPNDNWILAIAYSIPVFYFIGLVIQGCLSQFSRSIQLIDYVINEK